MHARRTIALLTASLLVGTAACGTHTSDSSSTSTTQVAISSAISVSRTTEPAHLIEPEVVGCSTPVDDFPDAGWPAEGPSAISDALARACDYRVTGQPCEEDELCAVQQVRETGDYNPKEQ